MTMNERRAVDVALRFVERINRRELEPLVGLMTDDHRLIDISLEQGV